MGDVIDKAKKRLQALETEAEQIRAFIHMYEKLADEEAVSPAPQAGESSRPTNLSVMYFSKHTPAMIVEAAKELMREKQRPLTRSELVRLLTLRGVRLAGTDRAKNLGTIIWRSKEFQNVEGKGYWPKEMGPWEEGALNL